MCTTKIAVALVIVLTSMSVNATPTTPGDLLVSKEGVNIRAENSLSSKVVRQVKRSDVFFRLAGETQNGFAPVQLSTGEKVWIFERYLTPMQSNLKNKEAFASN